MTKNARSLAKWARWSAPWLLLRADRPELKTLTSRKLRRLWFRHAIVVGVDGKEY
jgi:hypothetical protein